MMQAPSVKPFACPIHKTPLADGLFCPSCNARFPRVDGIPVLINDANSIFSTCDYLNQQAFGGASSYGGSLDNTTGLRRLYRRTVHHLTERGARKDFDVDMAVDIILSSLPDAEILVIGSGDASIRGNATYTDVAFGKHVHCIADAHDLPFVDGSFDACIAVAVLEHVVDPYRCVQEIMRVLRPGGYVYSETPFMQPLHLGPYDFTRFTYLGHRRLFRFFREIRSGMTAGPGTSAGQMIVSAMASMSGKHGLKRWLRLLALLLTYPMRWLDHMACLHRGAYDSASGFYFFGTLHAQPIADRELIGLFRDG